MATWKWPIFSVPNLYSFSFLCRMNIVEVCLNITTFILVSEGTTMSNSHAGSPVSRYKLFHTKIHSHDSNKMYVYFWKQ